METENARSDADEVSVDEVGVDEVNVVDNPLPNPSVTGLAEDETEDLDSPEFFHRSRSAIRSGVKNVCENQTQDLVDSIKKEVGAFERRLTEDSPDNLPPRELDLSEQPMNNAFGNVTSTPAIQEFAKIQDSIEQNIRQCNSQTEEKIEGMLDQVSECLQEELFREQQHLMLMQDKLDTSSQTLSRVEQDLTKKLEAEKNSRSLVQRTVRENKEFLIGKIHMQELEVALSLNSRVFSLQGPCKWTLPYFDQTSALQGTACM
eukprot:gene6629-7938_t